jgi:hypothetical protein
MAFFFFLFFLLKIFSVRNGAKRNSRTQKKQTEFVSKRSEALHLSIRSRIRQKEKLIFKSYVMLNFIIKTHKKDTVYTKPHLFVLNKGMNSGKPQKEPFTNSFVIIFQNEEDCETLFFIAYSLWQTKFWHQHLVGSVIPFFTPSRF